MTERRLLVVSDDLLSRLDALRSTKSREQFLELCVLLIGEVDRMRGDRTRLDFLTGLADHFADQEHRIRELEQVTITFLQSLENQPDLSLASPYRQGKPRTAVVPPAAAARVAAALQRAPEAQAEELRRELWPEGGLHTTRLEEGREAAAAEPGYSGAEAPEERYNRSVFNIVWLVAAVLYGFGDTVTSFLVISGGGAEANPIMRFFANNGGITSFIAAKTLILAGLFALSVYVFSPKRRSGWVIPVITAFAGLLLVINNLVALASR